METARATRARARLIEDIAVPASKTKRSSATPNNNATANANAPITKGRQSPSRRASPARKASPSRRSSPARKASPSRTKASPVRKGTKSQNKAAAENQRNDQTIKNVESEKKSNTKANNLPTTLTTNTVSLAANNSNRVEGTLTSSYNSSDNISEMRTSSKTSEKITLEKAKDLMRRSVSKTFSTSNRNTDNQTPTINTENGSQYSRSVSCSTYDDESASKAEFSDSETKDDEQELMYKSCFNTTQKSLSSTESCRKVPVPKEFGGWFGILVLMVFGTFLTFYLVLSCTKASCLFDISLIQTKPNIQALVQKYFTAEAIRVYLGFYLGIFILSALLFGKTVKIPADQTGGKYTFNLLPMAILLTIAFGTAEYYKYPVADFVLRNYRRICVYGLICSFVTAIWAYLRPLLIKLEKIGDTKDNIYGKSGNFLVDFALGKQVNPKWLGVVELKLVFYRASLLIALIFAESFIYKNVQIPWIPTNINSPMEIVEFIIANVKYNTVALLSATMLLIYLMDTIVFEHHLASSFELQGEGFGYLLLLRYTATPFLLSSVAKYTSDRQIPLRCKYVVYVSCALLILGLVLKRLSSAMKYKYRTDSTNKIWTNMETVHTFQGRRLLLGPFWGRLRQPNYTGDIIALISLMIPLYLEPAWPPIVSISILIVLLFHRASRVNARNLQMYHSSWVRYCSKVSNYIIPKIY